MSWLRVERDDLRETMNLLKTHGIRKNHEYTIHEPGWNSIVTGKQYRSMSFVLFLFKSDSAEVMANFVIKTLLRG